MYLKKVQIETKIKEEKVSFSKLVLFAIILLFSLILSSLLVIGPKLYAQSLTPEEVYSKVNGSVLFCTAYNYDGYIQQWGSAVVINSDGIVYTCFHIFNSAEKLILEKDGNKTEDVIIIGAEPEKDILILKIEPGDYPSIAIGNSDSVKIGEAVYTLGNPKQYKNTFSSGIISAVRTENDENEIKKLQFTASISGGSSGGAIFNDKGELIGITYQSDSQGQNINFAIPINYYKQTSIIDWSDSSWVNAMMNYCLGYSSFKAGGYFKANEYFNKYLELFPYDRNVKLQSAENYSSRGQYDSAIARADEVITVDSLNKKAYLIRAENYSFKQDTANALCNYEKALETDSSYYNAWISRACYNHYNLKRYDDAMYDYNKSISLRPEWNFILLYRGELYLAMGDTEKAVLDLIYSGDDDIDIAATCYLRGQIFSSVDRNYEAILDFTSAIKKDPYNADYYFSRAVEYSKTGDNVNAISDYNEAIKQNSTNAPAFNNLAYSHLALNELDDAERYFKRALYFDKYHFDAFLGLSMISYKRNELKDCIKNIKNAVEIEPLLKKGIKGIKKLEKKGYFWSMEEKSVLNEIFKLAGFKHYSTDKKKHAKRGKI